MGCVPGRRLVLRCHTSCVCSLNISETAVDRRSFIIESNGRPESIDDVTDDVTWPDDVITVMAGVPRGRAHSIIAFIGDVAHATFLSIMLTFIRHTNRMKLNARRWVLFLRRILYYSGLEVLFPPWPWTLTSKSEAFISVPKYAHCYKFCENASNTSDWRYRFNNGTHARTNWQ